MEQILKMLMKIHWSSSDGRWLPMPIVYIISLMAVLCNSPNYSWSHLTSAKDTSGLTKGCLFTLTGTDSLIFIKIAAARSCIKTAINLLLGHETVVIIWHLTCSFQSLIFKSSVFYRNKWLHTSYFTHGYTWWYCGVFNLQRQWAIPVDVLELDLI